MGCWGMGMTQSDEFCEIYDRFMEAYDEGGVPEEIAADILAEYRREFSDDDGIMHDVYFALAKAQWMCCALSADVIGNVGRIMESGANLSFYRELGATESDLKVRKKNLDKFRAQLQNPRPSPRKRKPATKCSFAEARRGMVFWYRSKGAVYGAVVLDVLGMNSILVALSVGLDAVPKSVEAVLAADAYTASWFGSLLPEKRVHEIGSVDLAGSYNGRAGMYQTETVHFCENFGMDYQWEHEKCVWDCRGMKMSELLCAENLPSEFRNREQLEQLLKHDRPFQWISVQ